MSWRDDLLPAAWRGIAFHVEGHTATYGRRVIVDEHPQRDLPTTEDMGRRARRYEVDAYLIGDDYMERRDRLIEMAERSPLGWPFSHHGDLSHPYLGSLMVALETAQISERTREGGMVRMRLVFVESRPLWPATRTSAISAAAAARARAKALTEAAGEDALERLVVDGVPDIAREGLAGSMAQAASVLAQIDVLEGSKRAVQEFGAQAQKLVELAGSIATAPATLVGVAIATYNRLQAAVGNQVRALSVYENLLGQKPKSYGTSAAGAVATANAQIALDFHRMAAAGGAVAAAAEIAWGDLDEALAARARLLDAIEDLEVQATDPLYAALADVRSTLIEAVPPEAARLPRVRRLRLPSTRTTITVAYALYGNLDREEELDRRNAPRRPGFLAAGQQLEVLAFD